MISRFTYFFKHNKKCYVYSGITNAFAELEPELYDLLKRSKHNPAFSFDIEQETLNQLQKAKIIVADSNEEEYYIYQKKLLKNIQNFQNHVLNLTIAPTSNCNFKCPYCFEQGIQPKTMSTEIIDAVNKFIKQCSLMCNNTITLTWYGGEPLLAKKQIDKILNYIYRNNIQIRDHGIITNGYLLNKTNIEWLINNKINFVQITLDGANAETHDSKRFLKNGKGSWNTILKNIDTLLEKTNDIRVSIRCNIDKSNKDEFLKLKETLSKRWEGRNITIYPAILRAHSKQERNNCLYLTGKEATDFFLNIGKSEKKLNYFNFEINSCTATQLHAYLIGPEGELYKCWNDLGRKNKIIGYVYNNEIANEKVLIEYLAMYDAIDDKKCRNCALFFVCDGGCQLMRIEELGYNHKQDFCHLAKNNLKKYLNLYKNIKNNT